jgi:hypothetical protein
MKIFPDTVFTIHSNDSLEVVRQRLISQVQDSKSIESSKNYLFKGEVSEHEFSLSLIDVKYFNFYKPVIIGKAKNIKNGVEISIKMALKLDKYPLYLVCFICGLYAIPVKLLSLMSDSKVDLGNLMGIVFLIIVEISYAWTIKESLHLSQNEFNLFKAKLTQIW